MQSDRYEYLKKLKSKLLAIEDDRQFLTALRDLPAEDVSDIVFVDTSDEEAFPRDLAERFNKIGDANRERLMKELNEEKVKIKLTKERN